MLTWCKSVFDARAMPLVAFFTLASATAYADDGGQLPLPFGAGGQGIIDFEAIVKHLMPIVERAVEAAVGVGVVVLAATVCWRFFRRFISG